MRTLDSRQWGDGVFATYQLWCYRRSFFAEPHDHTFFELFWVQSGLGSYWINGQEELLAPGDLVLVRPEDQHSFAAAREAEFCEFVNVAFTPEVWRRLRRLYFTEGQTEYFEARQPGARRFQLSASELRRLDASASALRSGARDRLTIDAFVCAVLSLLHERKFEDQRSRTPDWLLFAADQIRHFPNFVGGPGSFVRLAGRSPEHVARECRRCLNKRPLELVNEARMTYAANELLAGQKSILEIALECGIETLGHFYRLFRLTYGETPALFRQRNQSPAQVVAGGESGKHLSPHPKITRTTGSSLRKVASFPGFDQETRSWIS